MSDRPAGSGIRPTIRLRLTVQYGLIFLAAALLLIASNYVLVDRSMSTSSQRARELRAELLGRDPATIPAPSGRRADLVAYLQDEIRDETLDRLLRRSLLVAAFSAIAAFALGWLLAGRALAPIGAITRRAQRIGAANLHERLGLDGPDDELKELADTIDDLLERLDGSFESQRRFAAAASHELRSPLAIIRAQVDVLRADPTATERERELADAVARQVARSDELIDRLLTLARTEGATIDRTAVDLAAITGDVVGDLAPRADRAGLGLHLELGDAVVVGDGPLLERLVANLVENAIRYNEPGGFVRVAVGSVPHVRVVVENSGPVVPPEAIATLLEPFERRGGTDEREREPEARSFGLGMTVVRAVVAAHRGLLHIDPRPTGGLRVEVGFPEG